MQKKPRKKVLAANDDLLDAFRLYNSRYFRNRLKVDSLRFGKLTEALGNTHCRRYRAVKGQDPPDRWEITINSRFRDARSIWATTLLHEMVHLEQKNQFACQVGGYRFHRRMKQLAAAGAFNGIW